MVEKEGKACKLFGFFVDLWSSGAPPELAGPVTPSQEGWLTSRTWKGRDRAGEQRAAHHRRPADTRPGVRSAAQRVAGGAPQPDRLRRPGRSSSRRLRCCRKVAPPLLHDRPLRLRPDDDSSSGAGSWEERPGLLQARADGARRGALSGGGVRQMLMQISPLGDLVRQVIWGLCRAASRGAPGRRTSGAKSKYSEIPPAFV